MLWYGSYKNRNWKNWLRSLKRRFNKATTKNSFIFAQSRTFYDVTFYLYIPPMWKISLLNKKINDLCPAYIFLYSSTYFYKLNFEMKQLILKYDPQSCTFCLQLPYTNYQFIAGLKNLKTILNSFSCINFIKMRFKGKGYYAYKNRRNTISPRFGFAHKICVYAFNVKIKKLSKTAFLLFGWNKKDLFNRSHQFKRTKPINIFTGRGVRFAKQIVYKKTGKVSAYR